MTPESTIAANPVEARIALPWPPSLTAQRLRELLRYDEIRGEFHWLKTKSKKSAILMSRPAGCIGFYGYRVIRVDGKLYRGCRLAWLWTYGVWPTNEIDHINGDRADDRLSNLREATRAQNLANTRGHGLSGVKGVSWHAGDGKWRARYRRKFLGNFETRLAASAAYEAAIKAEQNEFAKW